MLDKGNSGSSRIILLKDYTIYTGKLARNKELHVENKKQPTNPKPEGLILICVNDMDLYIFLKICKVCKSKSSPMLSGSS